MPSLIVIIQFMLSVSFSSKVIPLSGTYCASLLHKTYKRDLLNGITVNGITAKGIIRLMGSWLIGSFGKWDHFVNRITVNGIIRLMGSFGKWDHFVNGIKFSKIAKALKQSVNQSVCRLMGQRETDSNNRLILISESTKHTLGSKW